MRVWVAALLLVPMLAGCAEDGAVQSVADLFREEKALDGPCGQAYKGSWSKQAILDVSLAENATLYEESTVAGVTVDGLWEEDKDHRSRGITDEAGCTALRLSGAGTYVFTAFHDLPSGCFLSGTTGGRYDGETAVVSAHVVLERRCP